MRFPDSVYHPSDGVNESKPKEPFMGPKRQIDREAQKNMFVNKACVSLRKDVAGQRSIHLRSTPGKEKTLAVLEAWVEIQSIPKTCDKSSELSIFSWSHCPQPASCHDSAGSSRIVDEALPSGGSKG